MSLHFAKLSLAVLLAFGVSAGAHAQAKPAKHGDSTVLPVWNKSSNKVEAFLLLEPANKDGAQTGARWRFGNNDSLDAAFGLESGDSLALLCDRQSGTASTLGNLANNCVLGAFDDNTSASRRTSATAAFSHASGRVGLTAGSGRDTLPAWLSGGRSQGQVDLNDVTVFARKDIGREGMVEIAGTMAKARLISPAEASTFGLADQWKSRSLNIGGGYRTLSGNIALHEIDMPGQKKWEGIGLGLTWRTPWSGQLTVGADNLITRGKNPFSPTSETDPDEGAIPYVRYEQDL